MARKSSKARYAVAIVLVVFGVALAAYPFVSNYYYEQSQQAVSYSYQQDMGAVDDDTLSAALSEARQYNDLLSSGTVVITDPFDPNAVPEGGSTSYNDILNLSGNGIICFLEIPCINVDLPVFHGTSEKALKEGVGHLENTSFPVGGESTHAVLSAHTGLVDKKLFTDLTLMQLGDKLYIHILDETLAYEVDDISVVEPTELDSLQIVPGEDLVTLVTCTPYGINSHRLLVQGHRVPFDPAEVAEIEEHGGSVWMQQYLYALAAGICFLAIVLLLAKLIRKRKTRGSE